MSSPALPPEAEAVVGYGQLLELVKGPGAGVAGAGRTIGEHRAGRVAMADRPAERPAQRGSW